MSTLRPPSPLRLALGAIVVGSVAVLGLTLPPTGVATSGQDDAGVGGVDSPDSEVLQSRTLEVLPPVSSPTIRIRTCHVGVPDGLAPEAQVFGQVLLAGSGEVLWAVDDESPTIPASVLKLVTARAALEILGPDYRFVTQVREGFSPDQVWLVGGGDPTLSRMSSPADSYYVSPPRMADLVDQLVDSPAAVGVTVFGVDASRYENFPQWDDTWRQNAAGLGFVTPVTALMVDGGRLDPAGRLSPRTEDPVSQAVVAFTGAWGQATGSWDVEVSAGRAPEGARVLAEVVSQPVLVLIGQMLRDSDNQIAEALIREVAVVAGAGSIDEAARFGLPDASVDSDVFHADDGSGLSQNNRMTSGMATAVLAQTMASDEANLVTASLAVPGEAGSLLRRLSSFGEAAESVRAKTGSLVGVRSLAGIIDGPDDLIFSVFITGPAVDDSTRDDIDALVEQFYSCGENLAHLVPTDSGE